MKLIVGLGNYGKTYSNTRHNLGFMVLDNFLMEVSWQSNSYGYYYKNNDVIFLKSKTFVNLSAIAVNHFMKYYKITIENILIIHDDLDLTFGKIKLKKNSSSGGHNGIKSIISILKTEDFLRLKIGIKSEIKITASNYVLGKFTRNDQEDLTKIYNKTKNILNDYIDNTAIEDIMNIHN